MSIMPVVVFRAPRRPTESPRPVAPPPSPRLTRRGRLAVVLTVAVLLLTTFSLGRVTSASGGTTTVSRHVVVGPGDTLWGIAHRIAPDADPRVTVAELERLNRLSGAALQAGQELRLPG